MPELPDILLYCEALERRVVGVPLEQLRVASAFVLRSVAPPATELEGREVRAVERLGKRVVLHLEGDFFVVIHLMIAGRLRWRRRGAALPRRTGLAALDFPAGTVLVTEASRKQRAAMHFVKGRQDLSLLDPGGLEVFQADLAAFREAITRECHTLKRTFTDPRLLSGIGNAYSDEILHAAALSPFKLTTALSADEIERLYHATRETLTTWTDRLRVEAGDRFPERVTAFRDGMAVHGRYRKPCPACGAPVQRIRYAENEANYCARCQTGGRLLADRALSRLLREDWPRTLDEWELRMGTAQKAGAESDERSKPTGEGG
jgi:formamidopyrimidine-DNA glycosylase